MRPAAHRALIVVLAVTVIIGGFGGVSAYNITDNNQKLVEDWESFSNGDGTTTIGGTLGNWVLEEGSNANEPDAELRINDTNPINETDPKRLKFSTAATASSGNGVAAANTSDTLTVDVDGKVTFDYWVKFDLKDIAESDQDVEIIFAGITVEFDRTNGGNNFWSITDAGGNRARNSSTGFTSQNTWYHIEATVNNNTNTTTLSVNGTEVASGDFSNIGSGNSTVKLRVVPTGTDGETTTSYWEDLKVRSTAISTGGGGSSDDDEPPAGQYIQTFELNATGTDFNVQRSTLTAIQDGLKEGETEFDFRNEGEIKLIDGEEYNLRLRDSDGDIFGWNSFTADENRGKVILRPGEPIGIGACGDNTYIQSFELDSRTKYVQAESSTLDANYWTNEDGLRFSWLREVTLDTIAPATDLPSSVSDANTEGIVDFDPSGQADIELCDPVTYDLEVQDQENGGFWRYSGFKAEAGRGPFTLTVTLPDEVIGPTKTATGTVTPTGTTQSPPPPPEPTLDIEVVQNALDDCWSVQLTYFDPAGETERIEYSFTADGTEYSDVITFEEPISFFVDRIHQRKFQPNVDCEGINTDPDGTTSTLPGGATPSSPDLPDIGPVVFVGNRSNAPPFQFEVADFNQGLFGGDGVRPPIGPDGDGAGGLGLTSWLAIAGAAVFALRQFRPNEYQALVGSVTGLVGGLVDALRRTFNL